MAIVTFSTQDRRAEEARAVVTALSLWLREQPRPEQATPAAVKFEYDCGELRSITITLDSTK